MVRREWIEIKEKVARLHPSLELGLTLFEENAHHMTKSAEECRVLEAIGWLSKFSEFKSTLRKDAEGLRRDGLMSEKDYVDFTHELITFHDDKLKEVASKLTQCVCQPK